MPRGFPGVAATPNEMTTNLLIKDRYCEKPTEQTRRLPVGVSLIINPEHFDRIMAAFSNSRHRFVVQQLLWNRYPQSVRPNIANGDGLNPQLGPAPFPRASPANDCHPRKACRTRRQGLPAGISFSFS
jgi:hypothetical protein